MFELMAAPRFYMTHCNGLANLQLEAGSIINFTGGLSSRSMNFNDVKQHY